jgi:hypothetical protein
VTRAGRLVAAVFGDRPRYVLLYVSPTILAIAMDFALRPRSLLAFEPLQWLNYAGSSLAAAGFWGGPIWLASYLYGRSAPAAKAGLAAFFAIFVLPLAVFCFGGQALYFHVFSSYMARDTVRLGMELRGTLGAWLGAWGGSIAAMVAIGAAITGGLVLASRRAAPHTRHAWPAFPIVGFAICATCFWVDFVESRSLQAAPPDTCFIHGAVHALRDSVTHKGWVRRGISLRQPDPLPPLVPPEHKPNVLLVITESVRADAMCSEPPPACAARFLDDVASDRVPLGRMTTQSSGTLSSCVMLWTGLGPDEDFATMHKAAVLWEVARAMGYRTGYIGAQNLRYEDFGTFLERAGLDVLVSAADLGGAGDPHLGAPDENATARMLQFTGASPGAPYFAVLHLSNTHWPYRIDPALQPFTPHDANPLGKASEVHNHYRNSVLMQERTVSEFLRKLRATPAWDDTAVLFVSDHGEEFREHGGMYHLSSLFDEQVRTPGWLLAGPLALTQAQRRALALWHDRRTFTRDVNATILDLLGALDARPGFPFASRLAGRSLLRVPSSNAFAVPMSTESGVWEPDDPKYGIMQDDVLVVRSAPSPWRCFDARADPTQHRAIKGGACDALATAGDHTFPGLR